MYCWKLKPEQIAAVVTFVSEFEYDGNLIVEGANPGHRVIDFTGDEMKITDQPANLGVTLLSPRTLRTRFCLRVKDSRGPGARRSASGRHGPWACWHAHRDVMAMIFDIEPDARIKTGMADYRGRAQFMALHGETEYQNIGARFSPVGMGELCDYCDL